MSVERGFDKLERVNVPQRVVTGTQSDLRDIGEGGFEGFALWVGVVDATIATVRGVIIPPQQPIRDEHGVGYLVTSTTLFALNQFLSEKKLRLIAQVHTHPTEAYHSDMDDKYAIVTTEGGFSLVIPDFARGAADMETWANYRLTEGSWRKLSIRETRTMFTVV